MSFLSKSTVLLLFVLCSTSFTSSTAYDAVDPTGNITIKWDVMAWTPDGYVAVVTIYNYQQYRHIEAPGWSLGWTWAKNEIIWAMIGAQTIEQGDCSRFKGNLPHSCKKNPIVVDLLPGTPYNQQIANCCKGGVISSWAQDPANAASSFQLSVGSAGTNNRTIKLPRNITLETPGPGYTCGPAKYVQPTKFPSPNGKRVTQAFVTWEATCTYSQFLAHNTPTCCVSLSSFNNKKIAPCPACSCGCQKNKTLSRGCVDPKSTQVPSPGRKNSLMPPVQCSSHMCPVKVNWHVKLNNRDYWRVKITITSLNYHKNYTDWNLVVQHPNFDNLSQAFSSNYKTLTPDHSSTTAAMLWGIKSYNDVLMQAGRSGNDVQLKLIFRKNKATFTSKKGWAFPQRIYFNGDICIMPPPDAYPMVA